MHWIRDHRDEILIGIVITAVGGFIATLAANALSGDRSSGPPATAAPTEPRSTPLTDPPTTPPPTDPPATPPPTNPPTTPPLTVQRTSPTTNPPTTPTSPTTSPPPAIRSFEGEIGHFVDPAFTQTLVESLQEGEVVRLDLVSFDNAEIPVICFNEPDVIGCAGLGWAYDCAIDLTPLGDLPFDDRWGELILECSQGSYFLTIEAGEFSSNGWAPLRGTYSLEGFFVVSDAGCRPNCGARIRELSAEDAVLIANST